MTVLDVNSVTKRFESDPIFTRVSFKVSRGQKVGLIGENGCGKSTLLKMIAGVETPTDGVVTRPGNSSVGYLAQQMQYGEGNTVYQELLGVFDEVRNMGRKLADLEADMSDPTVSTDPVRLQRTMDRYGELAAEFERLGGYAFEHRIDAVMEGLRISHLRDQPVHTLSGGEKNITALARILLQEPQILLLDEPANHLDFAGLAWLEEFLRTYSKTVILVSHNRYLLDRVVERILEIEDGRIAEYRGNYSAYRAEKLKALLSQKHAFDDQQKEISRLQEMIKRFEHWAHITDNARHARQARNKQKMLDNMEKVERPSLDRKRIDPRFEVSGKSGRIALELRGYSRAFGDQVLFADVDLHLSYGERVGVERELAAAYRDSDYKLGDRLAQSLRRVEAEVEGLYAEWGAG